MADDLTEFAGDVLLVSTPDGGDIVLKDGLIADCRNFDTAVLLSLFGGNRDDVDGREKETWWGNLMPGTRVDERMKSEFGAAMAMPITAANLRYAAQAAERDLAWTKEAGADDVDVRISAESQKSVRLDVDITQDAASEGGGSYELQWQEAVR